MFLCPTWPDFSRAAEWKINHWKKEKTEKTKNRKRVFCACTFIPQTLPFARIWNWEVHPERVSQITSVSSGARRRRLPVGVNALFMERSLLVKAHVCLKSKDFGFSVWRQHPGSESPQAVSSQAPESDGMENECSRPATQTQQACVTRAGSTLPIHTSKPGLLGVMSFPLILLFLFSSPFFFFIWTETGTHALGDSLLYAKIWQMRCHTDCSERSRRPEVGQRRRKVKKK